VAYKPDWEPLADAVKRVMAIGITEEAKIDLCRAVADRKIKVRVRIAASGRSMAGKLFFGGNVGVPAHLGPGDLDWVQSRPLRFWWIGPMLGKHYSWDGENLPIDLIELSTADVREVLCARGDPDIQPPAVRRVSGAAPVRDAAPVAKPGPGAKKRGIAEGLNELWPNGVPQGLSAKDRNRQIIDWLTAKGYSVPKSPERAIQRVLKKQSK
jgi:hypothetical protein